MVMSMVVNFVSKYAGLKLPFLHGEHEGKELGRVSVQRLIWAV